MVIMSLREIVCGPPHGHYLARSGRLLGVASCYYLVRSGRLWPASWSLSR